MIDVFAALSILSTLTVATVWLVRSDLRHLRIPNRPLLCCTAIIAVTIACHVALSGDTAALVRVFAAAGSAFAVSLAFALLAPGQFGGGDVKLLTVLAGTLAWFGWFALGVSLFGLVALLAVLAWTVRARRARTGTIPLAPSMFFATWLGVAAHAVASSGLSPASP